VSKITSVADLHLHRRSGDDLQRLLRAFTPAPRQDEIHAAIQAEINNRRAEDTAEAEIHRRLDQMRARMLAAYEGPACLNEAERCQWLLEHGLGPRRRQVPRRVYRPPAADSSPDAAERYPTASQPARLTSVHAKADAGALECSRVCQLRGQGVERWP
jgi:hypothetical protein